MAEKKTGVMAKRAAIDAAVKKKSTEVLSCSAKLQGFKTRSKGTARKMGVNA